MTGMTYNLTSIFFAEMTNEFFKNKKPKIKIILQNLLKLYWW